MTISGLPLSDHLPRQNGAAVLLLGGDAAMTRALGRAGYHVDWHALDTGPLAQAPGTPFRPPVVVWPFADGAYDAVILLDELALTVREEEALAEAARVLRPGGTLLLRLPATGPLAWLDGVNIYRYLRETTHRGESLKETAGVGWRRHYPRGDVRALLEPHFAVIAMQAAGLGVSEAVRAALLIFWRWLLRSRRGDGLIRDLPRYVARHEGGLALPGPGYWLVTVAERLSPA